MNGQVAFGDERLPARYWSKVQVQPDGCWRWTAATTHGYGVYRAPGPRNEGAHRVVYQCLVGPIADGFHLDHLCHSADKSCAGGNACLHRRCVNPAHLEPVTRRENILRGRSQAAENSGKGQCVAGHEFTPQNTYVHVDGWRKCRACAAARQRDYYRRNIGLGPKTQASRAFRESADAGYVESLDDFGTRLTATRTNTSQGNRP